MSICCQNFTDFKDGSVKRPHPVNADIVKKYYVKFWQQILNVTVNVMTPYLTFYKTVNLKAVKNSQLFTQFSV